jgi:hypothetical protein
MRESHSFNHRGRTGFPLKMLQSHPGEVTSFGVIVPKQAICVVRGKKRQPNVSEASEWEEVCCTLHTYDCSPPLKPNAAVRGFIDRSLALL